MRRGTTPSITISVTDADMSLFDKIFVTIRQNDIIINKTGEDVVVNGNEITTTLTQGDTLQLDAGGMAEIQIRAVTKTGAAVASNIQSFAVYDVLNEVVINAD